MDAKKLIEDVLKDLGNNKTLLDVSSKVQIIIRLLGDEKLKTWYNCEFVKGYNNEELPDYRKTMAVEIKATYLVPQGFGMLHVSNQSIPISNLGFEKYKEIMSIYIKDTISSIINYSNHPENISMSLSPYEKMQVQEVLGEVQIESVHKVIPASAFQTIIDNVQSKIIDMFMDLDQNIFNGEIELSSNIVQQQIQQLVNNNIYGSIVNTGNGSINTNSVSSIIGNSNSISINVKNELKQIIDEIENQLKSLKNYECKEIIDEIKEEISSESPKQKFLRRCFHALKSIASDIPTNIVANQISVLIGQALAML